MRKRSSTRTWVARLDAPAMDLIKVSIPSMIQAIRVPKTMRLMISLVPIRLNLSILAMIRTYIMTKSNSRP